jgi:hypothetical protein
VNYLLYIMRVAPLDHDALSRWLHSSGLTVDLIGHGIDGSTSQAAQKMGLSFGAAPSDSGGAGEPFLKEEIRSTVCDGIPGPPGP